MASGDVVFEQTGLEVKKYEKTAIGSPDFTVEFSQWNSSNSAIVGSATIEAMKDGSSYPNFGSGKYKITISEV